MNRSSGRIFERKYEMTLDLSKLTSIPIVMTIVCVILVLNVLSGVFRGFVRKISGIVAFLLAGILVTALLPTVTSWLHTTPVYGFIREQCETVGESIVKNSISTALGSGASGSGSAGLGVVGSGDGTGAISGNVDVSTVVDSVRSDDGSGSLDRSRIKELLRAYGYDPSVIDSMSDAELESYAQQLLGSFAGMVRPAILLSAGMAWPGYAVEREDWLSSAFVWYTPSLLEDSMATIPAPDSSGNGNGESLLSSLTAGMDRVDQTKLIESLPLPQSIKDQMETFNNENGYQKLGATDFGSYIINYFASLIMNILAYVVTLFVVWLIIRLILGALSVFRHLPIVGTADRLLGLLLGLIQGVLIVWTLFLVLSLFATTQVGSILMSEINASPFLSFLYNINPLLKGAAGAIRGIM